VGADVAILISGSGIAGRENYQLMLNFARQLVYGLNLNRKESQVSVVVFADDAYVRFYTLSCKRSTPSPTTIRTLADSLLLDLHRPSKILDVLSLVDAK